MTKNTLWMAVVAMLGVPGPAFPCSVIAPLPTPQALVERASLIVHARAEALTELPGSPANILAKTPFQIRFRVLDVHKGALAGDQLVFNGVIDQHDDWNERPIPYDFIRRGGRGGNCYALGYREGSEYLLLLNQAEPGAREEPVWSPYWAPLSPTNEQVRGRSDNWLTWVLQEIAKKLGA